MARKGYWPHISLPAGREEQSSISWKWPSTRKPPLRAIFLGTTHTRYMATLDHSRQASNVSTTEHCMGEWHPATNYLYTCAGLFVFSIEMRIVTAACSVELWISSDFHPARLRKVLTLEHPEQVVPYHFGGKLALNGVKAWKYILCCQFISSEYNTLAFLEDVNCLFYLWRVLSKAILFNAYSPNDVIR